MNKYLFLTVFLFYLIIVLNSSSFGAKSGATNKSFTIPSNKSDSTLVKYLRKGSIDKWRLENIRIIQDTLKIVSSNQFFYYPFGKYPTISSFKEHNKVWGTPKIKTHVKPEKTTIYLFNHLNSSLQVLKNNDTRAIDVLTATVSDKDILLVEPIVTGMKEIDFIKIFFGGINANMLSGVKVVKFESGVLGVWHSYYFANGRLSKIIFESDYTVRW